MPLLPLTDLTLPAHSAQDPFTYIDQLKRIESDRHGVGRNLHTQDHIDHFNRKVPRHGLYPLFDHEDHMQYWAVRDEVCLPGKNGMVTRSKANPLVYQDEHNQFEVRLRRTGPANTHVNDPVLFPASVSFFVDSMLELDENIQDVEMLVTNHGQVWFARRFYKPFEENSPVHGLIRGVLAGVQERLKVTRTVHENDVKSAMASNGYRELPFWLFSQDDALLEYPDLQVRRDSDYPIVVATNPINTGMPLKSDTFLSIATIDRLTRNKHDSAYPNHRPEFTLQTPLQIPVVFLTNPELEVRDAMKLYLTAGTLKNRRIVLEFNKFTTYYAETFGMRHAPIKGGATRFMLGNERAHLHIQMTGKPQSDYLEIRADFVGSPSQAFYGRIVAFIGAFMAHCRTTFAEDLTIDTHTSELVDFAQVETWGEWAYKEVQKRFPLLNSRITKK